MDPPLPVRNRYRVARSTPGEKAFNTLQLSRRPTFAVLELLDTRDSEFFRGEFLKRQWVEITPEAAAARKTYAEVRPTQEEIDEYGTIAPDWIYISGHYAPTTLSTAWGREERAGDREVHVMPSGFFNEPFHVFEWIDLWADSDRHSPEIPPGAPPKERKKIEKEIERRKQSLFLQTQDFSDEGPYVMLATEVLRGYFETRARKAREPEASKVRRRRELAETYARAYASIWKRPLDELEMELEEIRPRRARALRGLFYRHSWPRATVVLLVGCNTLTYPKRHFRSAFPGALVLGYINKNPANGTPHIRAFLEFLFEGIRDPGDPRLMDHKYVADAWMRVHRQRGLSRSERMAYMLPDGRVFAAGPRRTVIQAGTADQMIFQAERPGTYQAGTAALGYMSTRDPWRVVFLPSAEP